MSGGGGGSEGRRAMAGEVVAWAAMVGVEGCVIGLTIMASTAMGRGMSPFVFVVYTNGLASVILLPFLCILHKHSSRSRSEEAVLWTLPFLLRVTLLGFIGICVAQNLAFVGLSYSSPIVACGMANQIPALSFLLGILFRTTKFEWKRSSSQARSIGTMISFLGAISLTLYRGPTIRSSPSLPALRGAIAPPRLLLLFTSTHDENWVLGCNLFAASSFTLVIWNIVQVGTLKLCPQVMKVVSSYSLVGTIQSAALAVFLERDNPDAWRLGFNFELLVIILTAVFTSLIRTSIQIWCTRLKGPYFVPMFKPFGIPYASAFGSLLFADTFHYGSMVAAFICGLGYYTVLWGQMKDDEMDKLEQEECKIFAVDHDEKKAPLLQESQV